MNSKTLILIPTYNEINNIDTLVRKLAKIKNKIDILFIDDNSPDGTGKVIDNYVIQKKNIHVIHRVKKSGIGSAHLEGIKWAFDNKYSKLISLDGDLTHSPEDIEKFFCKIKNFDIVVGSRFLLKNSLADWSIFRKILTYTGHFITNIFLKLKYDSTCGFRIYNLSKIDSDIFRIISSKGYSFFIESLFILNVNGFNISEVPIILPKRAYGSSKMKLSDIIKSIYVILKLSLSIVFKKERYLIKKKISIKKNLIKKERIEWDEYWKEKTSFIKHIYNFIAYFYRTLIIKPALNYFFFKHFNSNYNKVLHAGCGSGQVDVDIAKKCELTALDISPKALQKYLNCHKENNISLKHGDIFNLPFKDKTFNIIFNLGVMEHFNERDINRILLEFKTKLDDQGKIILFWPPEYGVSVKFLKFVKTSINFIFKKNIDLHPDEISLIKSKQHAVGILNKAGFKIIQSYFGIRDLFTHEVIIATKR